MAKNKQNNVPGMRKQTIVRIESEGAGPGDSVVDKTETNLLGEAELSETTLIQLRHADGCGHVLHTASEVGGISACGKVLCVKCAENVCYRCGKLVCGEHIRRVKREDVELIYCWRCELWAYFDYWPSVMKWFGGGVLVLFLLKLLRGC